MLEKMGRLVRGRAICFHSNSDKGFWATVGRLACIYGDYKWGTFISPDGDNLPGHPEEVDVRGWCYQLSDPGYREQPGLCSGSWGFHRPYHCKIQCPSIEPECHMLIISFQKSITNTSDMITTKLLLRECFVQGHHPNWPLSWAALIVSLSQQKFIMAEVLIYDEVRNRILILFFGSRWISPLCQYFSVCPDCMMSSSGLL